MWQSPNYPYSSWSNLRVKSGQVVNPRDTTASLRGPARELLEVEKTRQRLLKPRPMQQGSVRRSVGGLVGGFGRGRPGGALSQRGTQGNFQPPDPLAACSRPRPNPPTRLSHLEALHPWSGLEGKKGGTLELPGSVHPRPDHHLTPEVLNAPEQ